MDLKISQENESRGISDKLHVGRRDSEGEPTGKLAYVGQSEVGGKN